MSIKAVIILVVGVVLGAGLIAFWPILLGLGYVMVAAIVAVVTILWSILVPLGLCVLVGYVLWLAYLGLTRN